MNRELRDLLVAIADEIAELSDSSLRLQNAISGVLRGTATGDLGTDLQQADRLEQTLGDLAGILYAVADSRIRSRGDGDALSRVARMQSVVGRIAGQSGRRGTGSAGDLTLL